MSPRQTWQTLALYPSSFLRNKTRYRIPVHSAFSPAAFRLTIMVTYKMYQPHAKSKKKYQISGVYGRSKQTIGCDIGTNLFSATKKICAPSRVRHNITEWLPTTTCFLHRNITKIAHRIRVRFLLAATSYCQDVAKEMLPQNSHINLNQHNTNTSPQNNFVRLREMKNDCA